jgi:alpha-tubulin suppressor-like RCC1 family protein
VANDDGQLGDGSTTDSYTPVLVVDLPSVVTLSLGAFHTCAVDASKDAWCWGTGPLGDGSLFPTSPIPRRVSGERSFISIHAGGLSTCAITLENRAFCWGSGSEGQLGNGSFEIQSVPTEVDGGLSFSTLDVADDGSHTCGVTTSGDAFCWGWNLTGQLGIGTTGTEPIPVKVRGNLKFKLPA